MDDSGLFISEGAAKMYWKLAHQGVTLAGDRMQWDAGHGTRNYRLADIFSVRLQRTYGGKSGDLGVCQISFRDGVSLTIYGGDAHGGPDETQAALYSDFVRDLHQRIAADKSNSATFHAGITEGRHMVVTAAIIAVGLMFVLLPAFLLLYAPGWDTLGVFATGGALAYGFYQIWDKNRPRAYSPDYVPEELLG